jgi:hypothetical protein
MPLDVARLLRSKAWLIARRRPELGFYMLNLWANSWHEMPAASIEDDDDVLADRAMCDPDHWPSVRADVLRGWIKCRDGRLYHLVVVDKAKDAWLRKCAQRARTEAARAAKKLRKSEPKFLNEINQAAPVTDLSQTCDHSVTASKGQGHIDSEAYASVSLMLAEPPPNDPIRDMWNQG